MQIKHLNIKNFRSIVEITIDFTGATALIGGNNSGKSTILQALDLFFDTKPSYDARDTNNGSGGNIEITATFINLAPDEVKEFGSAVINDEISIQRILSEDKDIHGQYSVRAQTIPEFEQIRSISAAGEKKDAYNQIIGKFSGLERARNAKMLSRKWLIGSKRILRNLT